MTNDAIIAAVSDYYTGKVSEFGATPKGVDWNGEESQTLRFSQLLNVRKGQEPYKLIEFGCGYGALVDYLKRSGDHFEYVGFDISSEMIDKAKSLQGSSSNCRFTTNLADVGQADYAVASGLFNVRLEFASDVWESYISSILDQLNQSATKAFAFNMLTSYSDRDKMRPDLYYGDPCRYFDLCKRSYSRNVALLHDYGLYEYTIVVRKT